MQQGSYLGDVEPGFLRDADDRKALEHTLVVAALSAYALWGGENPDTLPVAKRRWSEAGLFGDLTDGHRFLLDLT